MPPSPRCGRLRVPASTAKLCARQVDAFGDQRGEQELTEADPAFSLVVATKGRQEEFLGLLESLERQHCRDFELIIVEQNAEPLIEPVIDERWHFAVLYLHTPDESGASRGRNRGLAIARGEYMLFPDDDCWYPPMFLGDALERMRGDGLDGLTGRCTDEGGNPINGRFEDRAQWIDRNNVWTTQIEWIAFWRRDLLRAIGGFDEGIGVGAQSPWQAAEGQDLMLRALARGARCWYDPGLTAHDKGADRQRADRAMIDKARAYGRGMGFVIRKHRLGIATAAYFVARSAGGSMLAAVRGRLPLAQFHAAAGIGRLEGIAGRCFRAGDKPLEQEREGGEDQRPQRG